jgi:hypothetical protein
MLGVLRVQKVSDPSLKSSVREDHPDEGSRGRLKVGMVSVREVVRCHRSPGRHVDGGSNAEILVGRSATRWLRL